MRSAEVQNVVKVMKILGQFEMGLFGFYTLARNFWNPGGDFLVPFIQDEVLHAENLSQMTDRVIRRPDRFMMTRSTDFFSASAALAGLKNHLHRLEKGELSKKQILSLSFEMESWLVGFGYADFLKTDDPEFKNLANEISLQTERHGKILNQKLEEMKRYRLDPASTIRVTVMA